MTVYILHIKNVDFTFIYSLFNIKNIKSLFNIKNITRIRQVQINLGKSFNQCSKANRHFCYASAF